jgi:hypothetical protein
MMILTHTVNKVLAEANREKAVHDDSVDGFSVNCWDWPEADCVLLPERREH